MKIMSIHRYLADGTHKTVAIDNRAVRPTSIYVSSDFKIGVGISTYSSLPYVHLGLESWKRNYPDVKMLVHDDNSPEWPALRQVCGEYGADFEHNDVTRGHTVGDLSSFYGSLKWAEEKGIDVLVKFSRRFIPTYDWTHDFRNLAMATQAATFSNVCMNLNWGFRTECLAMHVPSWLTKLDDIARELDKSEVFCEGFVHNLARDIEVSSACSLYSAYLAAHPLPRWCNGHVHWELIGTNRIQKVRGILWHHSCHPQEYADVASAYGLPYSAADFTIPDSHLSRDNRKV